MQTVGKKLRVFLLSTLFEGLMPYYKENANLIWQVADLLRGDYKQADYGKIILPMIVLRRLDSDIKTTKIYAHLRSEDLRKFVKMSN